ncbi:hypothetical protein [Bifidobacterium boum]
MTGNTRVSMVLARMLTAILAVTGLAVVAPVRMPSTIRRHTGCLLNTNK